jgi:hypothetical protein
MLSSDRSEHRADHRRRPAAGWDDALWDKDAQPFDTAAPWDAAAAEALMSLYESEEGRLWRPAAGDRARPSLAQAADSEPEPEEGLDRAWLEAHLSGLAERLQQALAQADPQAMLAALTGRLETIEQRFGATLGRVAQRTDLDVLRAIETRVLELAAQLEQARERLDRIGAVDEEVRALARKVEEGGALRTGGLEKLLRDCITEWREGDQRTASALQHIEEAITRLGESVEAMEASKPAADLAVPPLTGTEPGRAEDPSRAFTSPPALYHSALDAADYAPRPFVAEQPAASGPPLATADASVQGSPIDWLPDPGGEGGRPAGARLTPGALRIMALRAKLRQSNGNGRGGTPGRVAAGAVEEQRRGEIRRASLSILLMAGAALVASSTYYLYQIYVVATAVGQ